MQFKKGENYIMYIEKMCQRSNAKTGCGNYYGYPAIFELPYSIPTPLSASKTLCDLSNF